MLEQPSFRTPLLPYHSLCSTCVTHGKPCHVIGHQLLPTQLCLGNQRISQRGGKYPKDVPLPTFLAYLKPVQIIIFD